MANPDGTGRFYCTTKHCGFEVPTQKQDMAKAMDKLADIKKKMFPSWCECIKISVSAIHKAST